VIFFATLFLTVALLAIERLVGIGWDFHVDSVTYAESIGQPDYDFRIASLSSLSNNGHYFIVSLLGSPGSVIAFNIFLISCANQIIYSVVVKHARGWSKVFLVFFLMNPYKLHLATTLLKDTAILFLLTVVLFGRWFSVPAVIPLFAYRNASLFYLTLDSRVRRYFFLTFPIVVGGYFMQIGGEMSRLLETVGEEMVFQASDRVPTFVETGPVGGAIARALIWPLLVLTGGFFILSPSAIYLPLFVGSLLFILVFIRIKIKIRELSHAALLMAFFAAIVPGFTTYYRYVFPILCLIPYLILYDRRRRTMRGRNHRVLGSNG
jgi:hypothetical protein